METYRILSCMLPPSDSLRSPLTSLRSPHMLGFLVVCLPHAPQQQLITHISPHMERTRGNMSPCSFWVWEVSPHLPPGSEVRGTITGRDYLRGWPW